MNPQKQRLNLALLFVLITLTQSGCAVLFGNVKPVDEKSHSYGVLNLSQSNPDWIALSQNKGDDGDGDGKLTPTEVSDVAYQSKSTASVISLNSACRATGDPAETDLKKLTDLLFLGIDDITLRDEQGVLIQNIPALQTTVRGNLQGEDVMLRTVVFRRESCIFDLVFLSRPQHFATKESDFSQFVDSLRLKE